MSECGSCTRSSAQVDVLQRQPALQWATYSPSIDEWIHNKAQPPYCMHVCVIITVSVWPWWKIITLSCTLDTIHVLSIFWIIVIYFYYQCQCLDLFPIRGGIYHTSNLHSLPAKRRKEHRGEGRRSAAVAAGREMEGNKEGGGGKERGEEKAGYFHRGLCWSCQAGVHVNPPDDNVAWHFWNERRVAMARSGEGQFLQGPK